MSAGAVSGGGRGGSGGSGGVGNEVGRGEMRGGEWRVGVGL